MKKATSSSTQVVLTNELGGLQELNRLMQAEAEERQRVEEAVKTNEALLRLFIKHTPAAIAMFDNFMRYLQVSDRFLTDYDLEGQDLTGKSHYEVFPNLPERWKEAHRRILAGAVERCEEDPYITADGSTGWLQWESLPWRKGNGEIGGLILFTQVITGRKRAEEALQASESRFSIAFNSNPMLSTISMLDGGRFLAVNDSFVALTGYSREEAVGHTALELNLWPNPDDRRKVMDKLKKEKRLRDFEVGIRMKNGEQRKLLLSVEKIELDGQVCLLHVANDVTMRKRAEEALRALSARLRSAREEEGTRIAREIHDELGGALTGLKWDLERIDALLIASANDSLIPNVHERITSMMAIIETTISTVRRIASELRPGMLDDLGLVAAIEWQVEQFQARTGIKCHWTNTANEVELDREESTTVFRILQEILTNVLRHAQATNLYVKLSRTKQHLELEVKDDGRGITRSQRTNPRSLGLLGMKERALLVGGDVHVTGKEGHGTTVLVRVPLHTQA
ncbi:MAG TPA: PAS domain S-box protein [Pyrinomonadaceae bacterium]|nr:PAS domain S-box protein [Pyrinomonadaceae bacterium]